MNNTDLNVSGMPFLERFKRAFSFDLRSFALMRMALGLVTMAYAGKLLFFLHLVAPMDGFVPMSNLSEYAGRWSLHFAIEAVWWQYLLIIITFICGFFLFIGYKTRLMGFLIWALVLSSFVRYKNIFNTGQKLIFYTSLWSTVLPMARVWAVDALKTDEIKQIWKKKTWTKREGVFWKNFFHIAPDLPLTFGSIATILYFFQICLMFWVSIYFKELNNDWMDGTAVYKALHHDVYASWVAPYVREIFGGKHTYFATYGAVFAEFFGPVFLVIPWKTNFWRGIGFSILAGTGLVFATVFSLGIFPYIVLTTCLFAMPGSWWDAILKTGKDSLKKLQTPQLTLKNLLIQCFAIFMFLVYFWGNFYNMGNRGFMQTEEGKNIFNIPYEVRTTFYSPFYGVQNWGVYIQERWYKHWMIIDADTENGAHIDAWRWFLRGKMHTFDPNFIPSYPAEPFKWTMWRNYMYFNLQNDARSHMRIPFLENICKQFNKDNENPARTMTLYLRSQEVLDLGEFSEISTRKLQTVTCK